jgi:asparagine synthase (glutamine-hydrolysing)
MCGITGWLDFGRDMANEGATVRAMTATLAPRGVDGQGILLNGHAGLGHTRTAIIDIAGGAQPFVVEEDGRPVAVIVYNGEVYNFDRLRTELEGRGHRFRTRGDTEVVLRAYREWGVDFAARLEGIFALAVWDVARERLVLVRDRLGVKPLYYAPTPDGVIFGSEPKALLANPLVRPVAGLDELREVFATAKRPGQAVFRGMHALRPGHIMTIDRDGVTDRAYWTLTARPHTDDFAGTVDTVRGLMDDIVRRELVADVPLCAALSGGLDSSTVSAIAVGHRTAQGGDRLRTFVTTFEEYTRNFRPDDVRFSPDEPYAAEVAAHLGSDHVNIMLNTKDLMDGPTRLAAMLAQDMPTTLGDMDTSNYLTSREIRRHSTVALSGEVADEIFGGYNWMFMPELLDSGTFPWTANEPRQPGSPRGQGRGLFDVGLMDQLDLGGYYADAFRTASGEAPHQDDESATERKMRDVSYATLTWWLPMLLDRGDRLSMAHGLELRVPYADHRLVEYLYNTPWALKTHDGREKSVLRAVARDLVPESVLTRTKSPWPVTQDPAYTAMLHDELAALVADPQSPVLPMLDLTAVRHKLAQPAGTADDWVSRMNVEMVLQFNAWLNRYRVDVRL